MGDYADDAIQQGIDQSWGWGRWRRNLPRHTPVKLTNQKIFSKFARDGVNFKTGDRVVYMKDGEPGVVIALRGNQIGFKSDNRTRPGAIFLDSKDFRFEV